MNTVAIEPMGSTPEIPKHAFERAHKPVQCVPDLHPVSLRSIQMLSFHPPQSILSVRNVS